MPVISAVGHEIDFTIADFVADVRAATPTMAAEIAVPNRENVQAGVNESVGWLKRYIENRLLLVSNSLREMLRSYALGRVRNRLETSMQSLDYFSDRLDRSIRSRLKDGSAAVDKIQIRLDGLNPRDILSRGYTICSDLSTGALIKKTDTAVKAGSLIITFQDGNVRSEVKEKM